MITTPHGPMTREQYIEHYQTCPACFADYCYNRKL